MLTYYKPSVGTPAFKGYTFNLFFKRIINMQVKYKISMSYVIVLT